MRESLRTEYLIPTGNGEGTQMLTDISGRKSKWPWLAQEEN